MSFEIVVFAILSLIVVFIIERIYRKVMELENKIDIFHKKFIVIEKLLQQHSSFMKEVMKEIKK